MNRLNPLNEEMDQVIKNAAEKLEYLSSDPETIALYRAREDALHERANMISSAKLEGKLEIVKNLLSMGMAAETVAKAAELPVAEIVELQKSLLN